MTEATANMLTEDEIRTKIEDYCRGQQNYIAPPASRNASVLIPLYLDGGEWFVLFTRRSEILKDHRGQVAFPGGAISTIDRNAYRAALREAYEEIGLKPEDAKILGRLKDYWTISDFIVSPIVARIVWPVEFAINQEEVSRVFSVPLSFLADVNNLETRIITLPNGIANRMFTFKPYDGEVVWGITARITVRLLKVLGLLENNY